MEKLLPRSCVLSQREVAPVLVGEKRKEDGSAIYKSEAVTQRNGDTANEKAVDWVNKTPQSAAEDLTAAAPVSPEMSVAASGERLFVFRYPPESCDRSNAPKRKKKNFLNLKKGSVAPTNIP